ncbi:MAG: hypothetical protein OXC26_22215 [Albidovulum sp.]|nr:hypothetical protein [Albidovulum sp.]
MSWSPSLKSSDARGKASAGSEAVGRGFVERLLLRPCLDRIVKSLEHLGEQ